MISVKVATAVGLGAIIGAGIFVLSGTAIALAGSDSLIAFIIVGIIALFVALELGELGSIMPQAEGGSYSFAYEAFGSEMGFITGIMLYFAYASSIAPITLGFGSYLSSLLGLIGANYPIIFAILLILVLTIVNILGISKAVKVDFILVIIKILILIIFIIFAFILTLDNGTLSEVSFTPGFTNANINSIFSASVVIFFAYSGFQAISTITKDVNGGGSGAAKAIISSVIVSILIYVLVVVSLLLLMPASQYTISSNPLSIALISANAPTWLFTLISIGALIATTSAALAMILSASRILYQIGTDKLLPKIVRKYNEKRNVAVNGVLISSAIGIVMLFSGNVYIMASISNFGILFCYLMASFALIHFRRKKARAGFRSPFYPFIELVAIAGLVALLLGMPREALIVGVALIIALLFIYYLLAEAKSRPEEKIKLFD